MGTDGGSEADTGRGTHRRRRLTHPTSLTSLKRTTATTTEKRKKFGIFVQVLEAEAGWSARRPRRAHGGDAAVSRAYRRR